MKNKIDFIKINSGRDGVINLNNMIPIPEEECYEINLKEERKKISWSRPKDSRGIERT